MKTVIRVCFLWFSVSPPRPPCPPSVPTRPHRDLDAKLENQKISKKRQRYQSMADSRYESRIQDHAYRRSKGGHSVLAIIGFANLKRTGNVQQITILHEQNEEVFEAFFK